MAIYGGFKITTAKNQLPLEITVKQIDVDEKTLKAINERLVLVYTGLTRLAKDLLINVLRSWYSISSDIYDNVKGLVVNGNACCRAIETGDLDELGKCISLHRKQKLVMAPGSEPDSVQKIFSILEPYASGNFLSLSPLSS